MTLDFTGKEIQVDDEVVIIQPNYRQFQKCKVIQATAKCVSVEYKDKHNCNQILRQAATQVVKV